MKSFPKYGDIENLNRYTQVLDCSVVVTEKLHGTNCRFMWSPENGGVVLGSRNHIIFKDGNSVHDGYKFGNFIANHPVLKFFHGDGGYDNHVFYGEFHGSGIQKGIKYCDKKDFRVFDIRDPEGNFLDWEDVVSICKEVGFKHVPVVMTGRVTLDDLNQIIDDISRTAIENGIDVADNTGEGYVIKPLKMRRDKRGNWMRAKYKSNKWAERASAPKTRRPNPEKMKLQEQARELAEQVVTLGRVSTVADHITRDGNTELSMRRTGDFLRAFINDVIKENQEVYDKLDRNEQNVYNKVINGYAVELWKEYLMK
jgi:Rnl2 family RNA ligase